MASPGDFMATSPDFAAGEVRGTRAWKVDPEGRLYGIVYEQIWRPGENVAMCLRTISPDVISGRRVGRFAPPSLSAGGGGGYVTRNSGGGPVTMGGSGGISSFGANNSGTGRAWNAGLRRCNCGCGQLVPTATGTYASEEPQSCDGLNSQCSCGFYVYQQGSNDYYSPGSSSTGGPIGGVVRGYGKVVLCTRGFRAEKAEILALYIDPDQKWTDSDVDDVLIRRRVARNYNVPLFNDYAKLLDEFPIDDPEPGDDFWAAS